MLELGEHQVNEFVDAGLSWRHVVKAEELHQLHEPKRRRKVRVSALTQAVGHKARYNLSTCFMVVNLQRYVIKHLVDIGATKRASHPSFPDAVTLLQKQRSKGVTTALTEHGVDALRAGAVALGEQELLHLDRGPSIGNPRLGPRRPH